MITPDPSDRPTVHFRRNVASQILSPPGSWTLVGSTDKGRRKSNEDNYFFGQSTPPGPQGPDVGDRLVIVADGMGGHEHGEVASNLAIEVLSEQLHGARVDGPHLRSDLIEAVMDANAAIRREDARLPEAEKGMGTTVVIAVLGERRIVVAHVGDSRAYLIRRGRVRRLTHDHSWVEEAVRGGLIRAEQAPTHRWRSQVTAALGPFSNPRIEVKTFSVEPGDRVLLCTDGMWEPLDEERVDLEEELRAPDFVQAVSGEDAELALEVATRASLDAGGKDNITGVMATLSSEAVGFASLSGIIRRRSLLVAGSAAALLAAVASAVVIAASLGDAPPDATYTPTSSIGVPTTVPAPADTATPTPEPTQMPTPQPTVTPTPQPTVTPTPQPTVTPMPGTSAAPATATVNADEGLNTRAKPSIDAAVLEVLLPESEVELTGESQIIDDIEWVELSRDGWVQSQFLIFP